MRTTRPRVVVAGNGMVSHRFCRELVRRAPGRYRITVVGEERLPAYDRIHLGAVLKGAPIDDLSLAPPAWYRQHGIELLLGDPIVSIDRRRGAVATANWRELRYDTLVLATGARPVLPRIPGIDLPGVLTYRTAEDVLAARLRSRRCASAAVLGGGLLGLEVARGLADMDIETYAIEASPHLLPRQLDKLSADLVHDQIERSGVRVAVSRRVRAIRRGPLDLTVDLEGSPPLSVDLVMVAAGVRPRDRLARQAGLVVDERGGVVVDDGLVTSDPRVLAIGDCASHRGVAYGLVGPGYQMARVVAERLAGARSQFVGGDLSCRLNVAGMEVASLGEHDARDAREVVHQDGARRRVLLVRGERIAGLRCVGPWPAMPSVERAMVDGRRVSPAELARFERTGEPWTHPDRDVTTVAGYPDGALVCHCARASFGDVRAQVARGCTTLAGIAAATGAGTVCGTCRPLLVQMTGDRAGGPVRARWPLLVASLAALAGVSAFAGLAPLPLAADGPIEWLSRAWRDQAGKHLSGYLLLGVSAAALALSLRKRVRALRRTPLTWFRTGHAIIGCLTLLFLVAHTGMHAGQNLNRALLVTFLGVLVTGALVGVATASSGRIGGPSATALRQTRVWLMGGHWIFLWLLPVLVGFHVLAIYYF